VDWLAGLTFAGRLTAVLAIVFGLVVLVCAIAGAAGRLGSDGCGPLSLATVADNQPFVAPGKFSSPSSACHTLHLGSDLPSLLLAGSSAMSVITYLLLFPFLRRLPVALVEDGLLEEKWLARLRSPRPQRSPAPARCRHARPPASHAPRALLSLPLGAPIASWLYGREPGEAPKRHPSPKDVKRDRRCVVDHLRTLEHPVPRPVSRGLLLFVAAIGVGFYLVALTGYYAGSVWWAAWSAPFLLPMVWIGVGCLGTYCALAQIVGYTRVMRALDLLSEHSLAPHEPDFRWSLQRDLSLVREGWRSARVMVNLKTVGFLTFIPAFYAVVLVIRGVPGYPVFVALILCSVLTMSWRQFRITQAAATWHEREVQRAINDRSVELDEATRRGSFVEVLVHLHQLDLLRESFDFPRTRRRVFVSAMTNAVLVLTGTAAAVAAVVPVIVSG
jgi:hypothetical protein